MAWFQVNKKRCVESVGRDRSHMEIPPQTEVRDLQKTQVNEKVVS